MSDKLPPRVILDRWWMPFVTSSCLMFITTMITVVLVSQNLDWFKKGQRTSEISEDIVFRILAPMYGTKDDGRLAQDDITVVLIDDETMGYLKVGWPIPYSAHARILDAILAQKPRMVMMDVQFRTERMQVLAPDAPATWEIGTAPTPTNGDDHVNVTPRADWRAQPAIIDGLEIGATIDRIDALRKAFTKGGATQLYLARGAAHDPVVDGLAGQDKAALVVTAWQGFGRNYPLQLKDCESDDGCPSVAMQMYRDLCFRGIAVADPICPPNGFPGAYDTPLHVYWGNHPPQRGAAPACRLQRARSGEAAASASKGQTGPMQAVRRYVERALQSLDDRYQNALSEWPVAKSAQMLWLGIFDPDAFQQNYDCPYAQTVRARDLLMGKVSAKQLVRDKIVFYGVSLTGVTQYVRGPGNGQLPGTYLHAMALDNLLTFGPTYVRSSPKAFWGMSWAKVLKLGLSILVTLIGAYLYGRNELANIADKSPEKVPARFHDIPSLPLQLSLQFGPMLLALVLVVLMAFYLRWAPPDWLSILVTYVIARLLIDWKSIANIAVRYARLGLRILGVRRLI